MTRSMSASLAADFNTGVGSLDGINGDLFIADPSFVNNDLFVDDSGSATDNTYTFDIVGSNSTVVGSNFSGTIAYDNFDTNTFTFLGGTAPTRTLTTSTGPKRFDSVTISDADGRQHLDDRRRPAQRRERVSCRRPRR